MQPRIRLAGTAVAAMLLLILGSGCASSQPLQQPPTTSYMKSTMGTPNELSPQAPGEAKNIRKVGNQWACEVNGRTMIYNDAASCWEPQKK